MFQAKVTDLNEVIWIRGLLRCDIL